MRMDKLTSKFQQALADAQSLALGRDHQFIEPAARDAGPARPAGRLACGRCSTRPASNVNLLRSQLGAGARPPAEGRRHGRRRPPLERPEPRCSTSPTSSRRSAATSTSPASCSCSRRSRTRARSARSCATPASCKGALEQGDRGGARRRESDRSERRGEPPGAREVHRRPDRARRAGQARSGHRPRRRDPPHRSRCCSGAPRTTPC